MDRIPILRMGEFLLVTHSSRHAGPDGPALQDDLTSKIEKTGAKGS